MDEPRTKTRKKTKGLLVASLGAMCLIAAIFIFWPAKKGEPILSLTYLGQVTTNPPGAWYYRFGITNAGNAPVVLKPNFGELQFTNSTKTLGTVGIRAKMKRLQPGMHDTIEIITSAPLTNRWRLKACFAHDNFRTRINLWTWEPTPTPLRVRARSYIPMSIRGIPMNVIAISDWIDDTNQSQTLKQAK